MNISLILQCLLASLSVAGAFIAEALGGLDPLFLLLIAMMCTDYITGVLCAALFQRSDKSETGALDSKAGFRGLVKKGVILLVVWIATLVDEAMGASYVRLAVILFFLSNEALSLIENLGRMNLPFPPAIQKAIESLQTLTKKGDLFNGNEEDDDNNEI